MGLPIADEALFTHNAKGFLELLAWVAIGARSSEDQEHRIFASAIDCAVGMKTRPGGSIEIGVNSIVAADTRTWPCLTAMRYRLMAILTLTWSCVAVPVFRITPTITSKKLYCI